MPRAGGGSGAEVHAGPSRGHPRAGTERAPSVFDDHGDRTGPGGRGGGAGARDSAAARWDGASGDPGDGWEAGRSDHLQGRRRAGDRGAGLWDEDDPEGGQDRRAGQPVGHPGQEGGVWGGGDRGSVRAIGSCGPRGRERGAGPDRGGPAGPGRAHERFASVPGDAGRGAGRSRAGGAGEAVEAAAAEGDRGEVAGEAWRDHRRGEHGAGDRCGERTGGGARTGVHA